MKKETILITGGLGYIGSVTTLCVKNAGYDVIVADDLSNSSIEVKGKIESLIGEPLKFYEANLADFSAAERVFSENHIDAVIHFAGWKAVGESVKNPLSYYRNNVISMINILDLMDKYKVRELIFSSSATVYGDPDELPLREDSQLKEASNPYGATKRMIERIIEDYGVSCPEFKSIILRYFNPIGSDESHTLGESPNGTPNNLMPYIQKVAVGELPKLTVFGNDYPTRDGTCIRDYIHVSDLATGHLKALERLKTLHGVDVFNLGSGAGTTVLELIAAFEKATGIHVPYVIGDRRPGDVAANFASSSKAERELGWKAEKTIEEAAFDSYLFQKGLI